MICKVKKYAIQKIENLKKPLQTRAFFDLYKPRQAQIDIGKTGRDANIAPHSSRPVAGAVVAIHIEVGAGEQVVRPPRIEAQDRRDLKIA